MILKMKSLLELKMEMIVNFGKLRMREVVICISKV